MKQSKRYAPEIRERAVGMVFDHEREYSYQWSTINSIADLEASDTATAEEIASIAVILEDINASLRETRENGLNESTNTAFDLLCVAKSVTAFSGNRVNFQTNEGIGVRTDLYDESPLILIPLNTTTRYLVMTNDRAYQGDDFIEIVIDNDSLSEEGGRQNYFKYRWPLRVSAFYCSP